MRLPEMKSALKAGSLTVSGFKGLDMRHGAGEGCLAWCENLSPDALPALCVRPGRTAVQTGAAPTDLFAWDGALVTVDGNSILYNGSVVGSVSAGEKQLAVVGSKLCVFPDKMFVDLESGEFGSLEATVRIAGAAAEFTASAIVADHLSCIGEFMNYTNIIDPWGVAGKPRPHVMTYASVSWDSDARAWTKTGAQAKLVSALAPGDIFIPFRISSATKPWAVGYSDSGSYAENSEGYYAVWKDFTGAGIRNADNILVATNFYDMVFDVYLSAGTSADLTDFFSPGDAVTITGCAARPENNLVKAKITAVAPKTLTFADGSFTAQAAETAQVVITRQVPHMDFICQCGDRLCGVSNAGENTVWDAGAGAFVTAAMRAVYLSAPGKPGRFWDTSVGVAMAVASGDDFTGCAGYSGDALFFKENALYRLASPGSGGRTLYAMDIAGLQSGSHKSLCAVNDTLYYKSASGVYAYSGGAPRLVSGAFGRSRFTNAAAGTDGLRYYISMADAQGEYSLFVYDPASGIWLREDGSRAESFTLLNGRLHMLAGGTVYRAGDGDESVSWEALFPCWAEDAFRFKHYRRLYVNIELGADASAAASISVNGGAFEQVWSASSPGEHRAGIPLNSRRCKTLRLKLTGCGPCVIKGLRREFFTGSEV